VGCHQIIADIRESALKGIMITVVSHQTILQKFC